MKNYCRPLFLLLLFITSAYAQDARETLGPKDKADQSKEPHALTQLMTTKKTTLKAELRGVHLRVYATDAELKALRERARTTAQTSGSASWQSVLSRLRALQKDPPPAPAQARRALSCPCDSGRRRPDEAIQSLERRRVLDAALTRSGD